MSNDKTDIDEILKSIDALLKEGETEHSERKKDEPQNDAPINDEPDIGEGEPGVEMVPAAGFSEDSISFEVSVDDEVEEPVAESVEEINEEADAWIEKDGDEAAGEAGESGPEPVARAAAIRQPGLRIVLSEEMLAEAEDAPELPLNFAEEDAEAGEMPEIDAVGIVQDEVASSEIALDVDDLIEQISGEINTRLQERLPDLLREMVAEAVRRHLGGDIAEDSGNPDGQ
jgi:hypothetical protein